MIIETRQQLIDNLTYAGLAMKQRLKARDFEGALRAQEVFEKLRKKFSEYELAHSQAETKL